MGLLLRDKMAAVGMDEQADMSQSRAGSSPEQAGSRPSTAAAQQTTAHCASPVLLAGSAGGQLREAAVQRLQLGRRRHRARQDGLAAHALAVAGRVLAGIHGQRAACGRGDAWVGWAMQLSGRRACGRTMGRHSQPASLRCAGGHWEAEPLAPAPAAEATRQHGHPTPHRSVPKTKPRAPFRLTSTMLPTATE